MSALDDIAAERQRQRAVEGWSLGHDDAHRNGVMARAAAAYAISSFDGNSGWARSIWPWDWDWWKPKDARRDLVRAGALIVAEIERLDREDRTTFFVKSKTPDPPHG